ncbi:hypothetical protein BV378_16345 [Nostoc sp. RF31YmG]|nr:hypothetical protein BV378_16345 [Nostoc sp. RF31YmG]
MHFMQLRKSFLVTKTHYLGWDGHCRTENNLLIADLTAIAVMERKKSLENIKKAWMINCKIGKSNHIH